MKLSRAAVNCKLCICVAMPLCAVFGNFTNTDPDVRTIGSIYRINFCMAAITSNLGCDKNYERLIDTSRNVAMII